VSGGVLLTGGTGFLGMSLLARLLEAGDGPEIFLAVRARDQAEAELRVCKVLGRLYDTVPASAERLRAVPAELTEPVLGLSDAERALLVKQVDRVVHCAASISFTLPLAEARDINVHGTRRVLELARDLPGIERFVHVSTAYVSGRLAGTFRETDPSGNGFRNTYELSKTEAEVAVMAADDLPTAIVRPSIVVGESDSGWTAAFNVLYWPLQAFARGLMEQVPADPDGIVDMIPIDYVAEVVERATFAPDAQGRYHAVAGERALTVDQLIEAACRELGRERPELVAPGELDPDDPISVFAPYFDVATRFDDRRARALMGDRPAPDPLDYLPRLLDFARAARWGKRTISRQAARAQTVRT
jgi:nucleoside-diphosphate-sugar epimerase